MAVSFCVDPSAIDCHVSDAAHTHTHSSHFNIEFLQSIFLVSISLALIAVDTCAHANIGKYIASILRFYELECESKNSLLERGGGGGR